DNERNGAINTAARKRARDRGVPLMTPPIRRKSWPSPLSSRPQHARAPAGPRACCAATVTRGQRSGEGRGLRRPCSGALAEPVQGLGQDRGAVGVVAALLHVGEVRLVRLGVRRRGWTGLVLAGRVAAPRAVPCLRDRGIARKTGDGLVLVA